MPDPIITAISPNFGLKTGNTIVTISGSNFNAPVVTINNVLATVLSSTNTMINILTFADTLTGFVPVTVTNADTATVTIANGFYQLTPGQYHQVTDVSAELLRRGFSLNTNIAASDLSNWIAQTEARVNGRIALRYTVPITQTASPQAYLMLAYICTLLTADRADKVSRNNAAADDHGPASKTFNGRTEGESMLEQILADRILLLDAIRPISIGNTLGGFTSYNNRAVTNNVFSEKAGTGCSGLYDPSFTVGKKQW